ncbi:MAG: pantetheine-phosphate adenylyltransferase [Ruminiclostridium sp.]|nr:pantetheine-phosphate adenylyltransferase [Ruminiclostridium sp.]
MRIFVYPGSFDPVTYGHIDIIDRAEKICDKLIVAVLENRSKTPVFTVEERVSFLKDVLNDRADIEIATFSGLLVDFMKEKKATTIIKGLRAVSDFEYELQMALLNKNLDSNIETLFMMTNIKYSYLSSSAVRELAGHGGNIKDLVPDIIIDRIYKKYNKATSCPLTL